MMRRLSYIAVSLLALVAALLMGDGFTQLAQGQTAIPAVVEPCINRDSFFAKGGAELIARADVGGDEHYLVHTYEQGEEAKDYPSALLVSVTGGSCNSELWNTPGDYLPYAQYVPDAAAIEFRFVEARMTLNRMGRQAFIESFNSPDDLDLFPEFLQAYERLGVLSEIQERVGES